MSATGLLQEIYQEVDRRIRAALKRNRVDLTQTTGVIPTQQLPTAGNTGSGYTPTTHQASHQSGGGDALTGNVDANARVGVRKNSAGSTYARRRLNLIEGSNVTLTVADDSGSEEVDITIAAASSSSSLTWFNVLDYGAVGDGTTNDQSAINSAIAALNTATRGVLYFPGGYTFKTTGALTTITAAALVMGDGAGSFDGAAAVSQITCTSSTAVLFTFTGKYATIRDLYLLSNSGGTPSAGAAILTDSSYLEQKVDCFNLHIRGFYDAIDRKVGAQDVFKNILITAPVRYGIRIRNTVNGDAGDWSIIGCNFYSDVYHATAAIRIESSGGGKIVNCKTNMALDNHHFTYGIDQANPGTATGILLVGNCSFENYATSAIRLRGTNWNIASIHGCQFGDYGLSSAAAIDVASMTDVIVDACAFLNGSSGAAAITLSSVTRYYIGAVVNNGYTAVLSATSSTGIDMSAGASGGAPGDATYVTLSTNGTLTDERVLTAGSGISITDGGAGSTVTLATTDEWSVLTNGDPVSPELIFASGDVVMIHTT